MQGAGSYVRKWRERTFLCRPTGSVCVDQVKKVNSQNSLSPLAGAVSSFVRFRRIGLSPCPLVVSLGPERSRRPPGGPVVREVSSWACAGWQRCLIFPLSRSGSVRRWVASVVIVAPALRCPRLVPTPARSYEPVPDRGCPAIRSRGPRLVCEFKGHDLPRLSGRCSPWAWRIC